jgi:hypothetical protein
MRLNPRVTKRLLPTLSATENTSHVRSTSILGSDKKGNLAMSAADKIALQRGIALQQSFQLATIQLDSRFGAIMLVPIRLRAEELLKAGGKKAMFSVMMRMVFSTASSLPHQGNTCEG